MSLTVAFLTPSTIYVYANCTTLWNLLPSRCIREKNILFSRCAFFESFVCELMPVAAQIYKVLNRLQTLACLWKRQPQEFMDNPSYALSQAVSHHLSDSDSCGHEGDLTSSRSSLCPV